VENDETHTFDATLKSLHKSFFGVSIGFVALVFWAIFAPLATTIHVSGTLVSSVPSYDIQHPYGGRIKAVFVQSHDAVEKGGALLELDMSKQQALYAQTQKLVSVYQDEIQLIDAWNGFTGALKIVQGLDVGPSAKNWFVKLLETADLEAQSLDENASSMRMQAAQKQEVMRLRSKQVSSMNARYATYKNLQGNGFASKSDADRLFEAVLSLRGDIAAEKTAVIALEIQAREMRLKAILRRENFVKNLADIRSKNEKKLPELRKQMINLMDELNQKIIRSPINGVIATLHFNTSDMVVGRGATIATLAQSISKPKVSMIIPTQSIDQVRLGMSGILTLPSLPQRNLPAVKVVLENLSPVASKDSEGAPTGFEATAVIDVDDLHVLTAALGDELRLSHDMPVSVALTGRKTTFASYLIAPFFKVFQHALQD